MKNFTGSRDVYISNVVIDPSDVSMIVDTRNRVTVRDCYIEDLDISTTNEKVVLLSCMFINAELVAPDANIKAIACVFKNYKGDKKLRHPIRVAKVINGYHTPVCAPKYV